MSFAEHFIPSDDYDDPEFVAQQIANAPTFPEFEENDEEAYGRHLEIEAANQPMISDAGEYDLMAGSDDLVADVLDSLRESKHAWTNFDEDDDDYLVAPEMVIDDMIAVGRQTIAGRHGCGKSVTCASLAMTATHLVDGVRLIYDAASSTSLRTPSRSSA